MCLGYPAEVLETFLGEGGLPMARVRMGAVVKEVILAVEDAKKGDYVIVHAGVAISKIDPSELKDVLALYEELYKAMSG